MLHFSLIDFSMKSMRKLLYFTLIINAQIKFIKKIFAAHKMPHFPFWNAPTCKLHPNENVTTSRAFDETKKRGQTRRAKKRATQHITTTKVKLSRRRRPETGNYRVYNKKLLTLCALCRWKAAKSRKKCIKCIASFEFPKKKFFVGETEQYYK